MKKLLIALAFILASGAVAPLAWAQSACNVCHAPTAQAVSQGQHAEVECARCHEGADQHASNPTQIRPQVDVSSGNCGECHQLIYDDYRYVGKIDQTPQKSLEWPLLPKLLSAHPFAKDYREPREHFNMLEDIELTTRGKGATCFTCKSADVYRQWNKEGGINYDSDVEEMLTTGKISHPITCVNCHDPHATETRIVSFALKEALDRMPNNHPGQRDPINTLVCAQCHVNYNFNPPKKTIEFPWRKVADMLDYTRETEFWKEHATGSWIHPELDMRLYKVQHPEVELYWESPHHRAGVTCASCHMPQITAADGTAFTQHFLGSPLNNLEQTCTSCHTQPPEQLREMVKGIQDEVYGIMRTTMDEMATAIDMIDETRTAQAFSQDLLGQARDAYFTAHLNWEWIAAENSMGFHNPEEAKGALRIATEKAIEAQQLAQRALDEPDTAMDIDEPRTRNNLLWILAGIVLAIAAFFILRRK
jgi:nitrite reductase (cytochrome c-552)